MENLASKSTSASNLEAFALSDVGCIRTNNEDNFVCQTLWTDNYLLLAAIDGVGGQEGGEVASAIAAESLSHYLETYTNGDALQLLKQAVRQANDDIFDQRLQRHEVSRMSCVLTSAIVDGHNRLLHMAHVGDTRLYIFVDGKLRKLSHDHSLVGYREEIGDLTEEEAMHHPQRNLISRDVGSDLVSDLRDRVIGIYLFISQFSQNGIAICPHICDALGRIVVFDVDAHNCSELSLRFCAEFPFCLIKPEKEHRAVKAGRDLNNCKKDTDDSAN